MLARSPVLSPRPLEAMASGAEAMTDAAGCAWHRGQANEPAHQDFDGRIGTLSLGEEAPGGVSYFHGSINHA